jgi:hypothetical protein
VALELAKDATLRDEEAAREAVARNTQRKRDILERDRNFYRAELAHAKAELDAAREVAARRPTQEQLNCALADVTMWKARAEAKGAHGELADLRKSATTTKPARGPVHFLPLSR